MSSFVIPTQCPFRRLETSQESEKLNMTLIETGKTLLG